MIYIAFLETKLPEKSSVEFSLKYVYGLNKSNSLLICKKLGFSKNLKVKSLSQEQVNKLLKLIELSNFIIGTDLKKFNKLNANKLISIKSYRGLRRNQGFPIRGQRTHTNAKTSRRNRN